MQTCSVRVLGLCGLHMFHWWWVSQQSGTEGCDVVPKLGYTWAVAPSLATSQLRSFLSAGLFQCVKTPHSLCNSHSPANLDFPIPLVIFRLSPTLTYTDQQGTHSLEREAGHGYQAKEEGLCLDIWLFVSFSFYFLTL